MTDFVTLDTWQVVAQASLSKQSFVTKLTTTKITYTKHNKHNAILTRMWDDAQRDGRPAEYRWRPLFNAAKFG